MKKLKLPVIKVPLPEPRVLSMDEYLEFVQFNIKYTLDKKAYAKQKKLLAVKIPFRLN